MTAAVRRRLIAFVLLSAVGVVYASANYLGLVDAILGRGYTVTAQLQGSGGLYEGSLVTYRGVQIGAVEAMSPKGPGITVRLKLDDSSKVPQSSPIFVHNGSAVGEQYLDFEPLSDKGPYLAEGDTIRGGRDSLPVDEGDLLVDMDRFVGSVDKNNLRTVVSELGQMFYNTGQPLQDLIDGGNQFVDEATANQDQTVRLMQRGRTVLRTQQANASDIKAFADGLAQVSGALRKSDGDIRAILQGGPGTMTQVKALLEGLEPTLPVLLSNLVTVNQVGAMRIDNIRQLIVTYPAIIAGGFTGTTPDGYGHVNLQYTNDPPPCTKGYLPPSQWRRGDQLSDTKVYTQAHCASGPPYTMRGANYHPAPKGGSARVAPYDPATGTVVGGRHTIVLDRGPASVYGKDAWKWMLIGPTVER